MSPKDGELIQRIIHSDLSAFDELFDKYRDSVYRFAFYLTQNKTEADDLFQETWLRVVKYLPTSLKIRDFKAWIITIVVNTHRDELRKKKVRKIFSPLRFSESNQEKNYLDKLDFEKESTIINEADRVEIGMALDRAISALPLKERSVFILKEIEGLKHAEIGEVLNTPVGTIKSLLHKAMKKLQQELSEFREG